MERNGSIGRRDVLRMVGTAAGAGLSVGVAGCGGGDGTTTTENEFRSAVESLDFGAEYRSRRGATFEEWPLEQRMQTPSSNRGDASSWLDSESIQTAPWRPPDGWEDTPAGDVDTLEILNYGDMRFDPATAAVDALFERVTGITVERVQVPMEQAIPKAAAFLSSGESSPHVLQSTTSSSMTTYAGSDWIEPVDFLMPEAEMWEEYLPLTEVTYNWNGHLWGGPGTLEGVPINVRADLLAEQGLHAELDRIRQGTWTWDDLETVMAAFEGTDVYGYGFRGGSTTDAERDWRMLWYQTGGQYLNDDGTVSVDPDGGGLVALERLVEWYDRGWLPPASVSWGESELSDGFLSDQLAMAPIATDIVADATAEFQRGEEYIIARPPKATDGPSPRHATYGGGPVSALNANAPTPQKVAGALFQDCRFSEAASWWEYVEEGNMAPARRTYEQADQHDLVWRSDVRGQVMEDAVNEVFPQQRALTQRVSREIQAAYAGEKSPADALATAQDYIDTVLGQS